MAKRKYIKDKNGIFNIFDLGGQAITGLAQVAGNVASALPNQNEINSTNINNAINTAVWGDSTQDPISRFINDVSGKSVKNALDFLDSSKPKFTTGSTDSLISQWNSAAMATPINLNTTKGVGWKSGLSLMAGAPWLNFKNNGVQFDTDNLIASAKGTSAGSTFGPWGALAGGIAGGLFNIGSRMGVNNRAKNINKGIYDYNMGVSNSYSNAVTSSNKQKIYDAAANYSADGGPLDMNDQSLIDIDLMNQYLYTKQLNNNKNKSIYIPNYSNDAEFKSFAEGGTIKDRAQHGSDFSNGVTIIGNGGTHEENPNNGVQYGIDPEGIPNLVEEDETIFNNFAFSNRIEVPNSIKKKYGLRGKNNLTFAKAAAKLQKESEERPNDPISKNTLNSFLNNLKQDQEFIKAQEEMKKQRNLNSYAGNIFDVGDQIEIGNRTRSKIPGSSYVNTTFNNDTIQNELANQYSHIIPQKINYDYDINIDKGTGLDFLRWAPVLGNALNHLTDVTGLTNRSDYTDDNKIESFIKNIPYTNFTPLTDYLEYTPADRNYYTNKLSADLAANRRNIINLSNGNRSTAMANMIGADYGALNNFGELARQMDEYNLNQKAKVKEFNRGTKQTNAQLGLETSKINSDINKLKLNGLYSVADSKLKKDLYAGKAISDNAKAFWDALGDVGVDAANRADRDFYIKTSVPNLPINEIKRLYGPDRAIEEGLRRGLTLDQVQNIIKAKGGKIRTQKKRGGFTY